MLRDRGPRGCTATHPYIHKVVSLICTPTTTYHFIPSNLQRHNRQLGYWWRAWSRWMIWTSYSDRGELGPLPTSPQRTCPGWRTRTRIGKPKEWSTEEWKMRADEDKRDPQGVKMHENEAPAWKRGPLHADEVPTWSRAIYKIVILYYKSLLRFD